MPESKLAEKLGFRVYEVRYPASEGSKARSIWWTQYPNGLAAPSTSAEIALWKLCLELSERLDGKPKHVEVVACPIHPDKFSLIVDGLWYAPETVDNKGFCVELVEAETRASELRNA